MGGGGGGKHKLTPGLQAFPVPHFSPQLHPWSSLPANSGGHSHSSARARTPGPQLSLGANRFLPLNPPRICPLVHGGPREILETSREHLHSHYPRLAQHSGQPASPENCFQKTASPPRELCSPWAPREKKNQTRSISPGLPAPKAGASHVTAALTTRSGVLQQRQATSSHSTLMPLRSVRQQPRRQHWGQPVTGDTFDSEGGQHHIFCRARGQWGRMAATLQPVPPHTAAAPPSAQTAGRGQFALPSSPYSPRPGNPLVPSPSPPTSSSPATPPAA